MSGGIEGVADAAQGALVADAAAEELKAARRRRRQVGDPCANCGAALQGPHCHMCGQVADDLHQPFWALVKDAVEGLFSLDGRFFRTIPALLFRPGRVTKSYLDGARARYVQPFRLFLVAAIVFLLAVATVTGDWTNVDFDGPERPQEVANRLRNLEEQAEQARASGDAARAAILDQVREELSAAGAAAGQPADDAVGESPEVARTLQREREKCRVRRALLPEELGGCPAAPEGGEEQASGNAEDVPVAGPNVTVTEDGDVEIDFLGEARDWPIGVRRFLVHQSEVVIDDPSRFLEAVNNWISRVLIGLFPVYALILAVMHFWKRRFFFYDHLIVSLHFHSFIFLLTTLLIVLGWFTPVWLLCIVFVLWGHYYIYKVHRVVYGCGRFSSIARTLVLDMLYFFVLLFVPIVLVISGFLTA